MMRSLSNLYRDISVSPLSLSSLVSYSLFIPIPVIGTLLYVSFGGTQVTLQPKTFEECIDCATFNKYPVYTI